VIEVPLLEKFTISYTGTIYETKQQPDKFFEVLRSLIDSKQIKDIDVRFYGKNMQHLQEKIDRFRLQNYVKQYGLVPRSDILVKQAESHALLLLNWEDESEKSVCPSKFFEYMASHRPVLATGGTHGDEIENIIQKTNCGFYSCTQKEIELGLMSLYNNYAKGNNKYQGVISEIDKYSFRNMAKQFADIFNKVS
jgi:glycosyltransferase involved in cell wall biosynthesis